MKFIAPLIAAYLLGSIPFSMIIAKAGGKDLRSIGSGNIGATNLARALGKKWGYFGFALDVLKGMLPTLLAARCIVSSADTGQIALILAVGFAAVLGHIFPIYLKFKGGKGVATSFGVALGFWPYYTIPACVAFVVWLIVVLLTKYISLASIVASIAFPVALVTTIASIENWQMANLWPLLLAAVLMPAVVIIRHRANIKRIIAGTESKILTPNSK